MQIYQLKSSSKTASAKRAGFPCRPSLRTAAASPRRLPVPNTEAPCRAQSVSAGAEEGSIPYVRRGVCLQEGARTEGGLWGAPCWPYPLEPRSSTNRTSRLAIRAIATTFCPLSMQVHCGRGKTFPAPFSTANAPPQDTAEYCTFTSEHFVHLAVHPSSRALRSRSPGHLGNRQHMPWFHA